MKRNYNNPIAIVTFYEVEFNINVDKFFCYIVKII